MRHLFAAFLFMLGVCLADRGNSLCQELAAARQAVGLATKGRIGILVIVDFMAVALDIGKGAVFCIHDCEIGVSSHMPDSILA